MQDALDRLDEYRRQAWADDLALREQARTDPELALIIAEADAAYLIKHGRPWVNPLTVK